MESNWIIIFTTGKLYLAEMAKAILEDNDIEVIVMNKQDSFYLIGDIEVYVKPEDVIRAKFLIKDL
ncbi:MAG: DUF2007 domain-containing protein [Salinivirgaceae bacterium]|jgi:hypothetical protein